MIAGIDYSTRAVDVVLLDEDSDAATWHRFELEGADAFERTRKIRPVMPSLMSEFWDEVIAVGIENPGGAFGTSAMYRAQGAILACLPYGLLVQPFPPAQWRKTVGLPGNASKQDVATWAVRRLPDLPMETILWPQDALDAYCIALATRTLIQKVAA